MNSDTPLPFDLPAICRKKLTVDFNGGNQSSDAGLLLLREAEPRLGVCRRLAAAMPDRRDPDRILHEMFEMVAARAMAIARVRIRDVVDARVRIQGRHRPRPAAPRSAHEGRRRPLSADRRVASVAIDHLSSGELPEQDRSGAACCGSPRSVRHDHEAWQDGDPRHRRHVLRGARRPAAGVLECASRRARLCVDAHLSRGERHAGGGHPAPRAPRRARRSALSSST